MLRRPIRLLLALAAFALPGAAWSVPAMTAWDHDHPLPARLGPFTLSVSRTPSSGEAGDRVILHVRDTDGRRSDLKVEVAFEDVSASLGVGRIDPQSARPQLLVTSYTGGAHCCVHIQALDFLAGRWRTVDVGTFDGEPFSAFPADVDGDGVIDIKQADDRFAYAFGCYACSWMPPRLFEIRGGKVRDVSAAPRYRQLYAKDFEAAKAQCLMQSNAACAAMVADGYRLGRADQAWRLAMANIDPKDSWLPGCKVKMRAGKCPTGQSFGAGEFRPALVQFLRLNHIAPRRR